MGMLETKLFEVRDEGTFIPVLAVRVAPDELTYASRDYNSAGTRYLIRRAGYGGGQVIMTRLDASGGPAYCDPYLWPDFRTYRIAHLHITEHWKDLESGDVVDVQFILRETGAPKRSESESVPR
jgi:hypothetical protein